MTQVKNLYPRGSEWRQWDLHVHTPASFHWEGRKFDGTDKDSNLVDDMIATMNEASPQVFALMDYWTFDGWFALKKRLAQPDAPALTKTVFPGIELRLAAPIKGRLNAHVIFSNEIADEHLHDFRSRLKLELIQRPLTRGALIAYARRVGADKLKHHGFKKAEVDTADDIALEAGFHIAELSCESYKDAIKQVPDGLAVGFMPFNTNDGLGSVEWNEHYAYAIGLFKSSPIFEARDSNTWAAFAGMRTNGNEKWIDSFQSALDNLPRLAVSGSDAHRFKGVTGDNNKRGYGDFPSERRTWIKADPTWLGLQQAIKEPEKRSFIGSMPPKLEYVTQNKTFYIDRLSIAKVGGSALVDHWLDGSDLQLNSDLVAIIGNKGSGKSALADILALLGNSQQQQYFSFLTKNRFRGKAGDPARHFRGKLDWLAGDAGDMLLSENPPEDRVELVKYIPQGRFEALCNDHVSGRSTAFEDELRAVIFGHVKQEVRLDALNFAQLIERNESTQRARLGEVRKDLHTLNEEIASIEDQLHPNLRRNLKEQLRLKIQQIEEHSRLKPDEVPEPAVELSEIQKTASERLAQIALELSSGGERAKVAGDARRKIAEKRRAIKAITERIAIFQKQFGDLKTITAPDFVAVGITFESVVTFSTESSVLTALDTALQSEDIELIAALSKEADAARRLEEERTGHVAVLNEPQQKRQAYLNALTVWQNELEAIEGDEFSPESKIGIETRLTQLERLPEALAEKRAQREQVTKDIYSVLSAQREDRAELFAPLQELIKNNKLIREDYKLQFQANLGGSPEEIAARLFSSVKQNVGEIRGDDESFTAIRSRFERRTFETSEDAVVFSHDIELLLKDSARQIHAEGHDIAAILRKDRAAVDVYDYVFGLEYLEPRYTLLFQDTQIEQLSPGQRGALLLIFYLLVDKGRNPIVLDQPEENLDNETVVSLLVPVLNEAKKNRQIIMVTHNPNLAVVCDAEQIIFAEFDRRQGPKIVYRTGSIENSEINRRVVTILEGTKPAFDNRSRKYHDQAKEPAGAHA
ncbi:ABC transporter [Rhizobium sullae]|uniref:ABC transporter n=1 Tax=Rhizobium sullae TaxID=50338 RepID=A0A2N0DAY3_RHISU|nr:AAA family ATPase [Rhizobium sullae]PKA43239.1 ABC transporter [Rhizobium sullae]